MNNSTNANDYFDLPPAYLNHLIGVIGIIAFLENIFILTVLFSTKKLLASSSLVVGLTIGHVVNGLLHTIMGFWSTVYDQMLVEPLFCIKIFWPFTHIATYQLLPLFLGLNGIERLLALVAPMWYRLQCTHKRLWYCTASSFLLALVSMILNAVRAWLNSSQALISANCIPPQLIGSLYTIYSIHVPAILGGLCASATTTIGVLHGRRRIAKMPSTSKSEINRVRKQIKLTQSMLAISVIDILCVVIPHMVLVLYNMGLVELPLRYAVFAIVVYESDSVLNIFAYLAFNTEFRKASSRLLTRCLKKKVDPNIFEATTAAPERELELKNSVMLITPVDKK